MQKEFKLKIALRIVIGLLVTLILLIGIYVMYVCLQYSRIEDLKSYKDDINQVSNEKVKYNTTYKITTYNIGFGAYEQNFSFFMDSGEYLDGKKVTGKLSRAKSKQTVLTNTKGVIDTINNIDPDFCFFQEVDTKANRSHKVNQYRMLQESLLGMSNVYVSNFHSAYLFYPIFSPHGKVESGITTFSKYQMDEVVRHSLEISDAFSTKFFDLDRCFTATYIPTEDDKYLVLVNVHLSAYDEGGVYRKKQWEQLNKFLDEEYAKGNYIVCGGDFNHDIANSVGEFSTDRLKPDWVYVLNEEDLTEHYTFATSKNVGTCRSTDTSYEKNKNYTVVVDGFIVSDNIEIKIVENIDTDFMYSDHNPVKLEFSIKK